MADHADAAMLDAMQSAAGKAYWRELVILLVSGYLVFNMNRGKLSIGHVPLHIRWLCGLTLYDKPPAGHFETFVASSRRGGKAKGKGKTKAERRSDTGGREANAAAAASNDAELVDIANLTIPNTAAIVLPSRDVGVEDIAGSFNEWHLELLTCLLLGTLGVFGYTEVAGFFGYTPPATFSALLTWSACTSLYAVVVAADVVRLRVVDDEKLIYAVVVFTGFTMATVVLAFLGEDAMDFHIESAHTELTASLTSFCNMLNVAPVAPSLVMIKLLLALACGGVAALLLHPQLTVARKSATASKRMANAPITKALLLALEAMPALIVVSFLPGVLRRPLVHLGVISDGGFVAARTWLILAYGMLRLVVLRPLLQAHYWATENKMLERQMSSKPHRVKIAQVLLEIDYVKYTAVSTAVRLLVGTCMILPTTIVWKLKAAAIMDEPIGPVTEPDGETETLTSLFSPTLYAVLTSFFVWWAAAVSLLLSLVAPLLGG